MRIVRYALVLLVVFGAAGAAMAQTGGLRVVVSDATGPLPGATVQLSSDRGYVKASAMLTDGQGVALFPVLRAGDGYIIEASSPGYGTVRQDGIHVKSGETLTQNIQLSQELVEKVVVTTERDIIDLDKPEQSTKFSDEFIQDLPVPGRYYQNVITMAPGVQDDDGDGNPTIHGSRARDFKPIVSGVSSVDPLTGQIMGQVNPNSIEEMEVITAGAGVEFGRAQGGFARIIQKQGSNDFEGLAELIYRSSKLDGNGASDRTGRFVPDYDWYQPSVQVSGPILRDKLWYRLSHEYSNREQPVDITTGVEVSTRKQTINSDQITWQVSPRNKLAFLYDSDPLEWTNRGLNSRTPVDSSQRFEFGGDKYTIKWTAPYSPKILVDTTLAWQDYSLEISPTNADAANSCVSDPFKPFLSVARCDDSITGEVSGAWPVIWKDERQRFTLASQATLYGGRFWGMNHQFKVGLSVENERYFLDQTRNPVIFRLFQSENEEAQSGGQADITRQEILFVNVNHPRSSQNNSTGTIWGMYAEDQIKPTPNLTITLGVRVDKETLNSDGLSPFNSEDEFAQYANLITELGFLGEQNNREKGELIPRFFTGYDELSDFREGIAKQLDNRLSAIDLPASMAVFNTQVRSVQRADSVNIDNFNFQPSLSVAWLPWSNGKTVFKATGGRKYNNIFLSIPLLEREPANATVELICINGLCDPSGGNNIQPNISVVDRDLKTPYVDEWTLSVERELWTESLLTLTYINRKYRDQFQDININRVPGDFGRCVLQRDPKQSPVEPTQPGDPDYNPGGGDGIIDDCVGELLVPEGSNEPGGGDDGGGTLIGGTGGFLRRPDGIPDLYTMNPIYGDVFLLGNFNQANYEAVVLDFVRRQYRGWEMNASYRWSMARGDGEDWRQQLGDDRSLLDDEFGFQSNDRRHEVKLNATTITPWGFRFGTAILWQSGLPYSILEQEASRGAAPPALGGLGDQGPRPRVRYVTGSRNDQRNPSVWNVDIKFTKEMNLPQGMNLQLSMEVFNLLNDGTYYIYNPFLELGRQVNGRNEALRRFGRQFQVQMKLTF